MTPILTWFLLATCSFLLGKSYIENLFRPYGGLPSVCRKVWLQDEENTPKDRFALNEMPDSFIAAILWTLLLITCILIWPVVLLQLVYWMIIKPDVTEFEEMHK